ncbi:MAG: hypothetical protein R2744_01440 [Bacteroidales bacterium]
MKRYLTACPRNCYSTCSFHVDVEDNRLVAIHPDRESLSVPGGLPSRTIERASSRPG